LFKPLIVGALIILLIPAAVFAGPRLLMHVQQGRQLVAVRQATAKYLDVNATIANG
jgi:hypothetical protein